MGSAYANTRQPKKLQALEPIKQIKAGVLDVGYYDIGASDGPPVLLLHGWPYDIHSYVDVAPMLAARGCRVIVPDPGHRQGGVTDPCEDRSGVLVPVLLPDRTRTGGADNPSLDNYSVTLGIADFELDFFGLVRDLPRVALEQ